MQTALTGLPGLVKRYYAAICDLAYRYVCYKRRSVLRIIYADDGFLWTS